MEAKSLEARLINALTVEERWPVLSSCACHKENVILWRTIKGRLNEIQFEKKLRLLGYSRQEFNNVIQNTNEIEDSHILEGLKRTARQAFWFREIRSIIDYWESAGYDLARLKHKSDISLTTYFFVEWALNILAEKIKTLTNIVIDTNVIMQIRRNFYAELLNIVIKTMVYEFNEHKDARSGPYTLGHFVEECFGTCEDVLEFYMRYPVLFRRAATKTRYLLDALTSVLDNINNHFADIREAISGLTSSKLTSLDWGVGDAHAKSSTVCILTFGDTKVVYKPHNSDIHKRYNQFLKWINKVADLLPFYTTSDYFAQSFSVCEFIEHTSCISKEEIDRYYVRMGQHLAVLFLLSGTDMHSENLIAMGEYPVIVDHETLFNNVHFKGEGDDRETVYDYLVQRVGESLMNTGFLPMELKGIDLGALAKRKQKEGIKRWVLTHQDDENIRFEYQDTYISENNNVPRLNEATTDYLDYADQILAGFSRTFLFFRDHADSLRHQIKLFEGAKVRIIMNATMHYAELYEYTSHPHYMTDMLMLDKLFENIWGRDRGNMEFYMYEVRDAHNCDIPIFHTFPDSTSLFASDGSEIEDFFDCTSLDIVETRLKNLEAEFQFETAILRKVLAKDKIDENTYLMSCLQRTGHVEKPAKHPLRAAELLARINDDIEKASLWLTAQYPGLTSRKKILLSMRIPITITA